MNGIGRGGPVYMLRLRKDHIYRKMSDRNWPVWGQPISATCCLQNQVKSKPGRIFCVIILLGSIILPLVKPIAIGTRVLHVQLWLTKQSLELC